MRIKNYLAESGLGGSLYVLGSAILFWEAWFLFFPSTFAEYRIALVGVIFDVFFLAGIFLIFEHARQKRQLIGRHQETIEDYKRWDSEEGKFRLAGAIRRLNRLGIFKLDLTGARLSDFDFSNHGIRNIEGTTFYDGTWGEPFKTTEVELTRVGFDWVSCRSVLFSPFNPLQGVISGASKYARYTDCTFMRSDLKGASFNGASLSWTAAPATSLYEDTDDDEGGQPARVQTAYSPFDGANLSGVSFVGTHFHNADFRNAENIVEANFTDAKGLETCIFDVEALENVVLTKARVRTS